MKLRIATKDGMVLVWVDDQLVATVTMAEWSYAISHPKDK
jgi:hypothetical protein